MRKIGIICATDDEFKPFLPHVKHAVTTEKAMLTVYEGQIGETSVVMLCSGVCKVNSAIAAQILIDTYGADIIINVGIAGGMDPKIQVFDTVISTEVTYHDVADSVLTEFHPRLPSIYFETDETLLNAAKTIFAQQPKVYFGRMVTGEKFIKDKRRAEINQKYLPLSVDMETAGIAHVCYVNKVPFIAIRCITDTEACAGLENCQKNCEQAACTAKDMALRFLEGLS